MKARRTSAAVIGVVGGIGLGMWIASAMTLMERDVVRTASTVAVPVVEPPAIKTRRVVTRAAAKPVAPATGEAPKLVMTVSVTAPALHDRMKPVLARGTRINLAVEGFSDAEQFVTIAHASRNTQVPFILLKHRVLTERRSLAAAIRASKPDLDAEAEVERARSAAKSDLAALNAVASN